MGESLYEPVAAASLVLALGAVDVVANFTGGFHNSWDGSDENCFILLCTVILFIRHIAKHFTGGKKFEFGDALGAQRSSDLVQQSSEGCSLAQRVQRIAQRVQCIAQKIRKSISDILTDLV